MDQVPLLNLGNQRLPSGTEFESAIYRGEQRQLSPDTYPQDRVRTCPDLGELVANPFLPSLYPEPTRVMYLLDIPRGGSNPYGRVANLTPATARILYGFIPLSPFAVGESSVVGGGDGRRGKGPA
jgi:hypothetical protein